MLGEVRRNPLHDRGPPNDEVWYRHVRPGCAVLEAEAVPLGEFGNVVLLQFVALVSSEGGNSYESRVELKSIVDTPGILRKYYTYCVINAL